MAEKNNDKHHFHHLFCHSNVILTVNKSALSCELIDISLKGCILRFKTPWIAAMENIYPLSLQLSDDINISMQISVTHVVANDAVFKCEHIDIDDIAKLYQLMQSNADNHLLERDLLALTEFRE